MTEPCKFPLRGSDRIEFWFHCCSMAALPFARVTSCRRREVCDLERVERVCRALRDAAMDGLICTLPMNVLLLSGYWPVTGASIVLFTRDPLFAARF